MIENYLPLIFALIIAIVYYLTNQLNIKLNTKRKRYGVRILSFAAGISITYVLLELFPKFTKIAVLIDNLLLLSIPFGFIAYHLIEKAIYQHNKELELEKLLTLEESIFSFIYHVVLGLLLVVFAKESILGGILVFIPILTFTVVSTLPMDPYPSKGKALFMSLSTPIGAFLTFFWKNIPVWWEFSLIGFATGILLYTIIRHHISFGRKGRIGYFTIGFVIYSVFIVMTWYL